MSSKRHLTNLHFVLNYEDGRWKTDNGQLRAEGKTLTELDEKLKSLLVRQKNKNEDNERIKVTMEFNYGSIPSWIVQYHPYYMYRVIEV